MSMVSSGRFILDEILRRHEGTKTDVRRVLLFGEICEIFDRIVCLEKVSADSCELVFGNLGKRSVSRLFWFG